MPNTQILEPSEHINTNSTGCLPRWKKHDGTGICSQNTSRKSNTIHHTQRLPATTRHEQGLRHSKSEEPPLRPPRHTRIRRTPHDVWSTVKLKVKVGKHTGEEMKTKNVRIAQGDCPSAMLFIYYLARSLNPPSNEGDHNYSRAESTIAPEEHYDHNYHRTTFDNHFESTRYM